MRVHVRVAVVWQVPAEVQNLGCSFTVQLVVSLLDWLGQQRKRNKLSRVTTSSSMGWVLVLFCRDEKMCL